MDALVGRFGVNVRYESQASPGDNAPAGGTAHGSVRPLIPVISQPLQSGFPGEAPGCTPSLAVP
jgi:hypothetical protein